MILCVRCGQFVATDAIDEHWCEGGRSSGGSSSRTQTRGGTRQRSASAAMRRQQQQEGLASITRSVSSFFRGLPGRTAERLRRWRATRDSPRQARTVSVPVRPPPMPPHSGGGSGSGSGVGSGAGAGAGAGASAMALPVTVATGGRQRAAVLPHIDEPPPRQSAVSEAGGTAAAAAAASEQVDEATRLELWRFFALTAAAERLKLTNSKQARTCVCGDAVVAASVTCKLRDVCQVL